MSSPRTKAILKGCSLGCGALALLVALGALWISHIVHQQSADPQITEYHPFRSPAAQARFLTHYDERGKAWPVAVEERLVRNSWGKTFVRVSGPGEAPALVLLPGAGGSSLQWLPNIERLSSDHRVYAVDNICDFGRSVFTRRLTSAGDFTDWLDQVLTGLALDDGVSLMGLSYGGWIASQYALAHPERLESVILIAPAGTVQNLSSGFIKRAIMAAIPHPAMTRNLIHWLAADSLAAGEDVQLMLEASIDDAYLALSSFEFRQMVNPHVLTDEELSSFDVPVLFLVGENEKIYSPLAAVERLNRVNPAIETRVVQGAGHDLTLVKAELVDSLVLQFLAEAAPGDPRASGDPAPAE
jgi:pimeloyl-ACP methyl ester carboxylesterase